MSDSSTDNTILGSQVTRRYAVPADLFKLLEQKLAYLLFSKPVTDPDPSTTGNDPF
jgi:hypothetical protein